MVVKIPRFLGGRPDKLLADLGMPKDYFKSRNIG